MIKSVYHTCSSAQHFSKTSNAQSGHQLAERTTNAGITQTPSTCTIRRPGHSRTRGHQSDPQLTQGRNSSPLLSEASTTYTRDSCGISHLDAIGEAGKTKTCPCMRTRSQAHMHSAKASSGAGARLDADDAVGGEALGGVCEEASALQQARDHLRLEHVELKVAVRAADGDGDVVAHDLRAHHRQRLALRRVDLAGHDRRPRLVLRQRQLPEAAARPGRQKPAQRPHPSRRQLPHVARLHNHTAAPNAAHSLHRTRGRAASGRGLLNTIDYSAAAELEGHTPLRMSARRGVRWHTVSI